MIHTEPWFRHAVNPAMEEFTALIREPSPDWARLATLASRLGKSRYLAVHMLNSYVNHQTGPKIPVGSPEWHIFLKVWVDAGLTPETLSVREWVVDRRDVVEWHRTVEGGWQSYDYPYEPAFAQNRSISVPLAEVLDRTQGWGMIYELGLFRKNVSVAEAKALLPPEATRGRRDSEGVFGWHTIRVDLPSRDEMAHFADLALSLKRPTSP